MMTHNTRTTITATTIQPMVDIVGLLSGLLRGALRRRPGRQENMARRVNSPLIPVRHFSGSIVANAQRSSAGGKNKHYYKGLMDAPAPGPIPLSSLHAASPRLRGRPRRVATRLVPPSS